jgi:hypothetical protein
MRFSTLFCAGLVACSLSAKAQDTPTKYAVKGVVSYFFNKNYGDKPDTGATAYVLTEEDLKTVNTSYSQIYRYLFAYVRAETATIEANSAALKRTRVPRSQRAEVDKEIEDANQKLAQQTLLIKQVGDSVGTAIIKLGMDAWAAKRVTSDGNGVFSKKVVPGKYLVLVISAHRQHSTMAEISGQIALKKVEVKDDDIELPFKFGM